MNLDLRFATRLARVDLAALLTSPKTECHRTLKYCNEDRKSRDLLCLGARVQTHWGHRVVPGYDDVVDGLMVATFRQLQTSGPTLSLRPGDTLLSHLRSGYDHEEVIEESEQSHQILFR
jgi:hypothetical protein